MVDCEMLEGIDEEFKSIMTMSSFEICSFQEGHGTPEIRGRDNKVVDDFSSQLGLSGRGEEFDIINTKHMQLTRCSCKTDEQYDKIVRILKQCIHSEAFNHSISLSRQAKTFRVRGVPLGWDVNQLQTLLLQQHSSSGPKVWSLTKEVLGRSQVATVSFGDTPRSVQKLQAGRSWRIALSASSGNQLAGSGNVMLDDSFLGITTLYSPPNEDHKIE
jgi:hypothetical protein